MKNVFLLILFCLFLTAAPAQFKPRFSTQNLVGLQIGASGQQPQVQSLNGIAWKQWFGGVGTGIDWYYRRSIPVFLTGARYFPLQQRKQLFVSAGAGLNFVWDKTDNDFWLGWYSSRAEFKNGMYWNTGLGYRLMVGKQHDALLLHVGYNVKEHTENRYVVNPCLIGPCPEQKESLKYTLRTLSLKLGWGF